jgi:hypothetical protein
MVKSKIKFSFHGFCYENISSLLPDTSETFPKSLILEALLVWGQKSKNRCWRVRMPGTIFFH